MLPIKVRRIANTRSLDLGIPDGNLESIIQVVSKGVYATTNSVKQSVILYEPHLFYKKLTSAARTEAVKLKLASKTWNKCLYGKTQADQWQ